MNNNTHYQDAIDNRPPLVRGPEELIRKQMDHQASVGLAIVHEQRIANLIALLSTEGFGANREEIVAQIRTLTGLDDA